MMPLVSCGQAPPAVPQDPWYEANKDVAGPQVTPQWVREKTVRGVRLGMDLDHAVAVLAATSTVSETPDRVDDEANVPWNRRYYARAFTSPPHDVADIAALARSVGNLSNEEVTLYATRIHGREIVSGITYRFSGRVTKAIGLGTPTKTFVTQAGIGMATYYVYAGEPDIAEPKMLLFLDSCNHRKVGHFGDPWDCDLRGRPRMPYLYVISYTNGITALQIRDAELARQHININRGR